MATLLSKRIEDQSTFRTRGPLWTTPPSPKKEPVVEIHCIFEARSALSESALWSPAEKSLYWLDQIRPEIHRLDPLTGKDEKLALELPAQLGALVPRAGGGFVLAASDGLSILDPSLRTRTQLANPIAALPQASFNDAKCDRQGRLWAGTVDRLETETIGCLYRLDPDGGFEAIADGFICSNGPSFSPNGRTMYHTRSHERVIMGYDIDPVTGVASNPRVFANIGADQGVPDGSTVDAEGFVWSAHWGGGRVTRYRPDGRVDRVIEMPVKTLTSCAFGGPDMDTLFVTSASAELKDGRWVIPNDQTFAAAPMNGGIFAIDGLGVRGLPEPAFRG
jgi:D-xylonolactonase